MFTKKLLTTLFTVATFLAHTAAQDHGIALIEQAHPTAKNADIIGISCGSAGNYALLTSEIFAASRDAEILLVYSEHPELKKPEILTSVAEHFANKVAEFDYSDPVKEAGNIDILEEACSAEIAKHIPPALTTAQDEPEILTEDRQLYTLIALYIQLNRTTMKSDSVNNLGSRLSCSETIWGKLARTGKIITHAVATYGIPLSSSKPIESAQHEAERLLKRHPDKGFNLVIDLKKWRDLCTERPAFESSEEKATLIPYVEQ